MRVVAILNAGAGTVQRGGPQAMLERLRQAMAACGLEGTASAVPGAALRGEIERARAEVEAGRLDGVIVGGGDGTANTAANVLAGSAVPLGVLGLGTLNHFAKDLGLPLEIEEAVRVIAMGHVRSVDVAEVNGRLFVNNSLIGVYPYMVLDRERRRRVSNIGKWPAMSLAFLRMLWRFPRRRLRLRIADAALPYRTPCLFVGNNAYEFDFLTLGRRRLDAGELYLIIAKPRSPLALFWLACRVAFGHLHGAEDLETLHARTAVIEARTSRLPVSLDGEVERLRPPLRYRTRPGALRVLAPPAP